MTLAKISTPVAVAWSIYDASAMTVVASYHAGSPMHLGKIPSVWGSLRLAPIMILTVPDAVTYSDSC